MKDFLVYWKREKLLVVAIIFLALVVRAARVYFYEQPVFADEAIYVRWAQVMQAENTLRFLPLSDGKQPLFMWVTIPFLKIFSDPLIAGRMLSVATGMGTLFGVMVFSFLLFAKRKVVADLFSGDNYFHKLFNLKKEEVGIAVRISLIAGLLYALSPFAVFFDSMALVDSMLSMFGVWVFVFAYLTVITLRLDFAIFTGFALGGALLTKSPAVYFALLLPLVLIFSNKLINGKKQILSYFKSAYFLFVSYVIAYGLYNILRLGPNFQMLSIRNRDYIYPFEHLLESPLDPLVPFLKDAISWFFILGPAALVLLFIGGVWMGLSKYRKQTVLLLALTFIPLFISAEFSKTFTARYILISLPTFVILAAVFAANNGRNIFFRLFILAFVLHATFINFKLITNIQKAPLPVGERSGYLEEWTAGYGIKEAADYLIEIHTTNKEEKIIVGTEGYFGTLPDGLQIYLNNYPEITVIGVGLDLLELPTSLLESNQAGNRTFLLINDTRLKADPQDLGLKTIAAYPKASRQKGSLNFEKHGPFESLNLFLLER